MFGEDCEWTNERTNAGLIFSEFLGLKLHMITENLTFLQEFQI